MRQIKFNRFVGLPQYIVALS